jgi:hypothetical protein
MLRRHRLIVAADRDLKPFDFRRCALLSRPIPPHPRRQVVRVDLRRCLAQQL